MKCCTLWCMNTPYNIRSKALPAANVNKIVPGQLVKSERYIKD